MRVLDYLKFFFKHLSIVIYIYCNAHIYIYILLTLKQIVVRSHAVDAEAPQAARPSEQGAALRATDVASDRMCHDVTESGKVGKTWVLYGVFFGGLDHF